MTIQRLLRKMLTGIFLFLLFYAQAQDRTVTGTVADDKGNALSGATIKIKGSNNGVSSDVAGRFSLAVPSGASTLEVSYVGFETQSVALTGRTEFHIALAATRSSLDEVVVVGYGTQKRKDVTGSVASVRGSVIKDQPVTSVTAALQGRAAGVEVINNACQPGASTPQTICRGLSCV